MTAIAIKHRFTASEFGQMIQAGVLTKDDRVELLDGEIIDMAPIGPGHNGGVNYLTALFAKLAPDRAIAQVQGPVLLDDASQPEPDLALLKPRSDYYRGQLPQPSDVLLIVEVADSSLLLDRNIKVPLYAKAGIPEMWLIDLVRREVVVHREPKEGKYSKVTRHFPGEKVAPLAFPKDFLVVQTLFG